MKKLFVTLACFSLLGMAHTNVNTETVFAESEVASETATVEINDIHGTVTVPVNPQRVIALDNRTFETLSDWDIQLVAVPKDVMPADSSYVSDDTVENIGNHREPNLEIIAAVNPDLVIVGQRFASYYEEIKALVPNAAVVDFSWDVSEEAEAPGENLINGFKDATMSLGQIFQKEDEANALVASLDEAIENAKAAYNGEDTILAVVVSGGEIGLSAPHSGRVWGPLYEVFDWVPALELDKGSSNHMGDDISGEAIAQTNPDWIFVLDRDAAVASSEGAIPAVDVIENSEVLQNTTAIQQEQVLYAPNDTYTNESIQTYIELFNSIATAFSK